MRVSDEDARACALDQDILQKLGSLDLLNQGVEAFGFVQADVVVLPSARFYFGAGKHGARGRKKFGDLVCDRVLKFLEGAAQLPEPNRHDTAMMATVAGIDPGEAHLLSFVARSPESILMTGDKRSLQAFAAHPGCQTLLSSIAGRVKCFERIMEALLFAHSFEDIRRSVVEPIGQIDGLLRLVFASGHATTIETVRDGLASYKSALSGRCPGLLLD